MFKKFVSMFMVMVMLNSMIQDEMLTVLAAEKNLNVVTPYEIEEEDIFATDITSNRDMEGKGSGDATDRTVASTDEVVASGTVNELIDWKLTASGVMTISGSGALDGDFMRRSGRYSPWNDMRDNIRKLVIEEGITAVGCSAFCYSKNLHTIEFADSIESIGLDAFYGCSSLTELKLPKNLKEINSGSFFKCTSLESVYIPKTLEKHIIGYYDINDCWYDDGCIFWKCPLKNVEFEEGTKEIVPYLFAQCDTIESIEIPNTVTSIGDYAFFWNVSLKNIDLPDSITTIGKYAFRDCRSLETVVIPSGVKNISSGMFFNCIALKDAVLPEGIETIGESAFYATGIETITIPGSVTVLDKNAFSECSKMKNIHFTESEQTLSLADSIFNNCTKLERIDVPARATSIGAIIGGDNGSLQHISVATGNKVYDSRDNCNAIIHTASNTLILGIATSQIPKSVRIIGNSAFYARTGMQNFTIPDGVTTIGKKAFFNTDIVRIDIPNSVTELGSSAFGWCDYLEMVALPDSLTSISPTCFWSCDNLKCIVIPKTVNTIGYSAFESDNALKNVYYRGSVVQWQNIVYTRAAGSFSYVDGNETLRAATIHYNCVGALDDLRTIDNLELSEVLYNDKYNVLSSAHRIETGHLPFRITCKAENPSSVQNYFVGYVLNDTEYVLAESTSGIFEDVDIANVSDQADLCVWTTDGTNKVKTDILLDIIVPGEEFIHDITWGGNAGVSFTIGDEIPLLGGSKISTPAPITLPVSVLLEDGKFKVGVNIKKEVMYDKNHDSVELKGKTFKEQWESFSKDLCNTNKIVKNRDSLKKWLSKDEVKREMPLMDEKVNFIIMGYGECDWTADSAHLHGLDKLEIKLVIALEAKETIQKVWVLGGVPFTLMVDISGSVAMEATTTISNGEWMIYSDLKVTFAIEPYFGIGVGTWISAGVYGKGQSDVIIVLTAMEGSGKSPGLYEVSLYGEAGLRVYFAKKSLTVSLFDYSKFDNDYMSSGKLLLYSQDKTSLFGGTKSTNKTYSSQKILTTEKLDTMSAMIQTPEESVFLGEVTNQGTVVKNVYGASNPQLLTTGDDTYLIYVGYDLERAEANQTAIYYAKYNKETKQFDAPILLDDDGTADCNPQVVTVGNEAYIAYQDSHNVYGEEDDPELSEYASSFGVSVAKFNEITNKFEEIGSFYNGVYAYQPVLCSDGEGVSLAWTENTVGNLFGVEGVNSVKKVSYAGDAWTSQEVVADNLKSVTNLTMGRLNQENAIAYTEDMDNNLQTPECQICMISSSGKIQKEDVRVSELKFVQLPDENESVLCGNVEGGLYRYDRELNATEILPTETLNPESMFATDGNAIYFLKSNDTCRNIYVANYIDGGWYVSPLTDIDKYIDSFCVGQDMATYLVTDASISETGEINTSSDINMLLSMQKQEISVRNVDFDGLTLEPGEKAEYIVDIYNGGTAAVHNVEMLFYKQGDSGNAQSQLINADLMPGETTSVAVEYTVPETLDGTMYVMRIAGDGNNEYLLDLSPTDLSVESEYVVSYDECAVKAIVQNRSYVRGAYNITIKDVNGSELLTASDTLAGQETKEYLVNVSDDMIPQDAEDTLISIEVNTDQEEYYESNNTCCQAIWRTEKIYPQVVQNPKGPYTITIDANNGTVASSFVVEEGEEINEELLPELEKEGYFLVDWVDENDIPLSFPFVPVRNMVIKAIWEEYPKDEEQQVNLRVTFDSAGGSEVESVLVTRGNYVKKPADPVKDRCNFGGWYLQGVRYNFNKPVTKDIVLTAMWNGWDVLDVPTANLSSHMAVEKGTKISLFHTKAGTTIYYTLDGTEPTIESAIYRTSIPVNNEIIIKAIAVKDGFENSAVAEFHYTVEEKGSIWGDVEPEDIPESGIPDGMWVAGVHNVYYTGDPIRQEIRVYDHKTKLQEKKDYTVSYKNNKNAAEYDDEDAPTIIVTGKGDYNEKAAVTFSILPINIGAGNPEVTADPLTVAYNGKIQKPAPLVTLSGKKLVANRDYTLAYSSTSAGAYTQPGTYGVVIQGIGNYTGSRTVSLKITNALLMNKAKVSSIRTQLYTGKAIEPDITVRYGKGTLVEGKHYILTYENNIEIGTASVVIKGIGSYSGTRRVNFKIDGQSIKKVKVTGLESLTYTGEELVQNPRLTLKLGKEEVVLQENRDYIVSYQKNLNVGTATVVFEGINGYTGTLKKSFKIVPLDIVIENGKKISVENNMSVEFAKGGAMPKPIILFDGTELKENRDYILKYRNNKRVALASDQKAPIYTVIGKGNFKGSIPVAFSIKEQDLSNLTIEVEDKVYQNKADIFKTKVRVIDKDGKKLSVKKDYQPDISYTYAVDTVVKDSAGNDLVRSAEEVVEKSDIIPANTEINVMVKACDNGSYIGNIVGSYRIVNADISKATVTVAPQTYSGSPIELSKDEISIKIKDVVVPSDSFEIVSYSNNIKKGKAKVVIRGAGNYGGTKTVTFDIIGKKIGFLWW